MSEANLWKQIRENLKDCDLQRLESGMTSRGIPDVNGCCDGIEFWIELKYTKTNKVAIRPEQVAWMLRRRKNGGRTFIIVKTPIEMYVYPGWLARDILDDGLKVNPIQAWGCPMDQDNWHELHTILTGYR